MSPPVTRRFVRAYPPAAPEATEGAIWLPFRDGQLLVRDGDGGRVTLVRGDAASLGTELAPDEPLYLGTLDGAPCYAYELGAGASLALEGWREQGLRALYGRVDEAEYGLAGYASQLLYWRRSSRFCAICGQPTEPEEGTWGRRCANCGHVAYPHVTPAVLVLVTDEADRILLASKPGWGTRYSILAGFVEPGESLEECAAREVEEEVGVVIEDLRYAGSQPWPFPHQIMIGFTGRYARGELKLQESEIAHAAWFTRDALPELPPPLSLSRQMIDTWAGAGNSR
uniref:NAD(+) diphosphatase n=1 Tax=uncultured Armatimonadetes bacterium TaxID=157466 RepID=A0A6J4HFQ1_9BACT|nr:NADH pyrophosphatase, decaps 5'-NAD modified RNA [uncultured Armatimonadetes bacterium]